MPESKRCSGCQTIYDPDHWANARENCPACGSRRVETADTPKGLSYEHYDSSADVKFDLAGLLTEDQRREARTIGIIGVSLILITFTARVLFVVLGRLEGFWAVPVWVDLLMAVMILMGVPAIVWAVRKLVIHRRVYKRDLVQDQHS